MAPLMFAKLCGNKECCRANYMNFIVGKVFAKSVFKAGASILLVVEKVFSVINGHECSGEQIVLNARVLT